MPRRAWWASGAQFLAAGASRVIVSLWRVDDEAARVLMGRFCRYRKAEGIGAAAALRRAQADLPADPRWSAPEHWAAWQAWDLAE
jgi:CHAT domain-containing protein